MDEQNQTQPPNPTQIPPPAPESPRGNHKLLIFTIIALLAVAAIFEISARIWLATGKHVPQGQPHSAVLAYYPELKGPLSAAVSRSGGSYHVLILSDSLFDKDLGDLAGEVKRQLEAKGISNVRVWNMSTASDTSRDSLVKYRWLEGKHFKWVIVCQGPGELLANRWAKGKSDVRKDYSHLAWYDEVGSLAEQPRRSAFAAPLLWDYLKFKLRSKSTPGPRPAPGDKSRDQHDLNEKDATTLAAFYRGNLEKIADMAKGRRDYLTLATHPWFLDPQYSAQRMENDLKLRSAHTSGTMELSYAGADYAGRALPCEAWGRPQDLALNVKKTNDAVRALARKRKIGLVDLATSIPARGEYYIDACRLSPAGVTQAARALVALAPPAEGAAQAITASKPQAESVASAKSKAPANKAASPATTAQKK